MCCMFLMFFVIPAHRNELAIQTPESWRPRKYTPLLRTERKNGHAVLQNLRLAIAMDAIKL